MPTASRLPPLRRNPQPVAARATPRAESAPSPAPPSPAEPKRSWGERLRGGTFGLIALGLAATVVGGIALRLTIKDGFLPLAPLFYALSVPTLVILGAAATLFGAMALGLRLTLKRLALIAALATVAGLYAAVFLFQDATFDDRPRLVLWNAANGTAGWDGVADALDDNHPTLAVLIESGDGDAEGGGDDFWRERFPDHFLARPGDGITVLSRGPIGRTGTTELPGGGTAATIRTQVGGERVAVLAVDLPANPTTDRGPALRRVAELAAELAESRPTIVAGDFNTPPDSVHFGALRRAGFAHAFERHGSGYAATWPVPAPVLHLDHVWLSPEFDVGEAWHGWTVHSDHRPVLVPARVSPERFAAARAAADDTQEEQE